MSPLVLLNLAVGFFGDTVVSPVSPFFVREKARALVLYAVHRPRCLGLDHAPLAPLVAAAERRYHLPRGVLAAVVQVESSGRPHRISRAGAMGVAQLSAATARSLGVTDPFDPEQALDGSARYLAIQLSRFHEVRLAVAAYNAGPGAIVGRTVPRNGETEIYVERVMKLCPKPRPDRSPLAPSSARATAASPKARLDTKPEPAGATPSREPKRAKHRPPPPPSPTRAVAAAET